MIKEKRIACGYTQAELARRLGVGQTTVAMWEIGVNQPRSSMLPRIAAALGCTINDLFERNDEHEDSN